MITPSLEFLFRWNDIAHKTPINRKSERLAASYFEFEIDSFVSEIRINENENKFNQ